MSFFFPARKEGWGDYENSQRLARKKRYRVATSKHTNDRRVGGQRNTEPSAIPSIFRQWQRHRAAGQHRRLARQPKPKQSPTSSRRAGPNRVRTTCRGDLQHTGDCRENQEATKVSHPKQAHIGQHSSRSEMSRSGMVTLTKI